MDQPDREPPPARDDDPQAFWSEAHQRAEQHARQLARRLDRVAQEIARSEEWIADTLEESARLRPHAADRLRQAAQEARAFAAYERRQTHPLGAGGQDGPDADPAADEG